MTDLSNKLYRVMVLFGPGQDEWFDSPAAALEFAGAPMNSRFSEYEDLAAEPFDGIFCERQDTRGRGRYEVTKAIPMRVVDDSLARDEVSGLPRLLAANDPR